MQKYGFVYIWFDRKHKRYYIGCHWGHVDDGYVCSSTWMRNAYKRRPTDFKRRILRIVDDRSVLFEEEHRWLNMIKPAELKNRYYNLRILPPHHWSAGKNADDIKVEMSEKWDLRHAHKRGKKRAPHTEETKRKMSERWHQTHQAGIFKGRKHSEESKRKMRETRLANPNLRLLAANAGKAAQIARHKDDKEFQEYKYQQSLRAKEIWRKRKEKVST